MFKLKTLLFALLIILINNIYSQEESDSTNKAWKTGGAFSLTAAQISYTNWAAGGENSISANSFVNLYANYKKKKMSWDNTLDLGYGLMRQGKGDNVLFYKTDDKIDFASKYGFYAFKHWYSTALISFKSQFAEGFNKPTDTVKISNFMAPAYVNISIGMDYKPNDKFTLYMSLLSGKITYVTDSVLSASGAYGVIPGKKVRYEFGSYIKTQFKYDITENISYNGRLDLFSNYLKNPQNIDLNFDNMINFKINNLFSANINITMIYDDDMKIDIDKNDDGIYDVKGSRLQIKQLFGIGITYKLR